MLMLLKSKGIMLSSLGTRVMTRGPKACYKFKKNRSAEIQLIFQQQHKACSRRRPRSENHKLTGSDMKTTSEEDGGKNHENIPH